MDDLFGAEEARDEALARVTVNSGQWMYAARAFVAMVIPIGWTGTAEEIRLFAYRFGIPEPHHPNVWGALIRGCIELGLLNFTGEMRKPKSRKSHARKIQVYRRGGLS